MNSSVRRAIAGRLGGSTTLMRTEPKPRDVIEQAQALQHASCDVITDALTTYRNALNLVEKLHATRRRAAALRNRQKTRTTSSQQNRRATPT